MGDAFVETLESAGPLTLHPAEVITALEGLLYDLHWRARSFARNAQPYDTRRMLWDTPELPGVAPMGFVEDDVAVGDGPLIAAPPERANEVHLIVATRRHAASGLCGHHVLYSEIPLDT